MLGLWKARTSGYLLLVQQSEKRQQHPATTTTTSTSAVSAQGTAAQPIAYMPPEGNRYIQLPAATTTTTSASASTGTTSSTLYYISVICDECVHTRTSRLRHQFHQQHVRLRGRTTTRHRRTSSLLRHQPAESRNIFETYLEGYFVAGYVGCIFADHVPLQPHYTQLSLSTATNQPIHIVSITQLDDTFTHNPHQPHQRSGKPHTYTILTAIESTTGLCTAVLTSKKGL